MAYFEAIRKLLSPAKKEGSGYFKTPSRLPPRLDRGRMSPKQRYDDWLKRSQTPQTPAKKVKASEGLGVKESKITKSIASPKPDRKSGTSAKSLNKFLNLLPSIIYKQHDRQGVEHDEQPNTDTKDTVDQLDDDLEGTTIVKEETPELSPKLQDKFDSDTTLIGNEEENSSVEKAKKLSNADTDAYIYSGWGPDEIWLFKKIKMCGLEPLFHHSWSVDFDAFGDQLFTTDDSKAFIKAENGRDFHGQSRFFRFFPLTSSR